LTAILILAGLVGFLLVFALFWCGVIWLISHVGGWHRLALRYGVGHLDPTGERCAGVRGMVGMASYGGVLIVHFCREGFYLEVMRIFRPGHPRLFIPWSDISARTSVQALIWKSERLSIGDPPVSTITLPAGLLEQHAPPRRDRRRNSG